MTETTRYVVTTLLKVAESTVDRALNAVYEDEGIGEAQEALRKLNVTIYETRLAFRNNGE